MNPSPTSRTERTLVVQPLPGIGDVVWHLPHLKAIAAQAPDEQITLLTKRRSGADRLLAGESFIDEVMYLQDGGGRHDGALGGLRLGDDLRGQGFDEIWILHHSLRYALAGWRAGIPLRAGYGIGWQDMFLTESPTLVHADKNLSAIAKADKLLALQSVEMVEAAPTLHPTEAAQAAAKQILDGYDMPVTILAIGASEPFKQWGGKNFAELSSQLNALTKGSIVLLGGPAEADLAAHIAGRVGEPGWLRAVTDAPLDVTLALVAQGDLCIGNDTGMLNVAAAAGTRSVGLFGGSAVVTRDPRLTPLQPAGGARYGSNKMAEISVEQVLAATGL